MDPLAVFEQERGQEILAALRAHEPARALQLAEHLVLESDNPTTDPRQAHVMLAAAAYVAQMDAVTDGDREYDFREAVAPWCTEDELREAAMIVLYHQGTMLGWLPAALHDTAKTFLEAAGSRYAEGFAAIERRDV